jgi:hypothetical protein
MGSERQKFRAWAKINISVPVRNQTSALHSLSCKYRGSFIFIVRPIILTPWSRGLLEKLTDSQLLKKFSAFLEPKSSLQRLQVPATCPYPFSTHSRPCPHITLPEDPSEYPLNYIWFYQIVCFPQVTPPKTCMHVAVPHTCYMPRPSNSRFDHPNNIW